MTKKGVYCVKGEGGGLGVGLYWFLLFVKPSYS